MTEQVVDGSHQGLFEGGQQRAQEAGHDVLGGREEIRCPGKASARDDSSEMRELGMPGYS